MRRFFSLVLAVLLVFAVASAAFTEEEADGDDSVQIPVDVPGDEEDQSPAVSVELTVESNKNQYNADLGFVCREEGVLPENAGIGEIQDWTPKY